MATHEVVSPLPGTFYRKPSPEAQPYVREGDRISAGDVVGLVEVMKTFNEVHADSDGRVARFLIDNDAPVEAGQALLVLER
jgi:biotin carboxyl carrier protein